MSNLKTMGFEMVNPVVHSETDRVALLDAAREIHKKHGYVSACGIRSGAGASFPKRIRLWVPPSEKQHMLDMATELRHKGRTTA